MLCQTCTSLQFRPLRDCTPALREAAAAADPISNPWSDEAVFSLHSASRQYLEEAVDAGCHLCSIIVQDVLFEADYYPRNVRPLSACAGDQVILVLMSSEQDPSHLSQRFDVFQCLYKGMKTRLSCNIGSYRGK